MHGSSRARRTLARVAGLAIALFTIAACGDTPTDAPLSPLAGLTESIAGDSTGNAAPTMPAADGPGYFHGTVLGPSPVGATGDTLASAPRIPNVVVTAYPLISANGAEVEVDEAAATVTTGADGKFSLPTLPGGHYVVTFTPPADSPYGGVWSTAMAHTTSHDYPWWVVLWRK
jgi:hypothetical protein